jgi:NAD(P)-dependent dehydrogenase (short-subunit alcohol dehydrogenase family)
MKMYDFKGRIIVVTGAAQGLGASIAKRFLDEGAEAVAMIDINGEALEKQCSEIDPQGKRTLSVVCNISDPVSVHEGFQKIYSQYGRVDVLINNAGLTRDSLAHKMQTDQFDLAVKVNLNGAFYCTKEVIASMKAAGWGRIIFMSSLAARGNIGQVNYSAAKAGIVGMTKTLAMELGKNNITVNCIAPGMINTDIIKTVPEKQIALYVESVPLKRIGEPEEVANLAVFLASNQAAYISGQCIKITGGLQ